MSGGVDSSVTAYLLQRQGFEVEGLSFVLWEARSRRDFSTCCSLEAIRDASRIANGLGIKHSVLDVRDVFIEKVIEPFVDSYTNGLTPNPCVLCNRYIKFPYLLSEADERGFDYIATGHYARIAACREYPGVGQYSEGVPEDHPLLLSGVADRKDQSYFLYALTRDQLKRLVLPLGTLSKDEVRTLANQNGLCVANKPESQEICFIEDRNYFKFIKKISPIAHEEGPVIDSEGSIVGKHRGIFAYTVGQRKRLGVSGREPLYIFKIDHLKNALHVGPREMACRRNIHVQEMNWLVPGLRKTINARVKVRSTMRGESARVTLRGDSVEVYFETPQWAPAPGQCAVIYGGDAVLGGGMIV